MNARASTLSFHTAVWRTLTSAENTAIFQDSGIRLGGLVPEILSL